MKIRVNGVPAPQGSKRHVGGGRMVESSRVVGPWREAVRAEAQRANTVTGFDGRPSSAPLYAPLSVTIVFVLPRPLSHWGGTHHDAGYIKPSAPKYPAKRPDLDKLCRAVLDGLVAGGVMADDSQVCSINSAKVYASNGEAPGAIIEVEAM